MRTIAACLFLLLVAAPPARADLVLVEPGLGLLQTYGPQLEDDGPHEWQDNRAGGFSLALGHPFGANDVSLGFHLHLHNHLSGFFLAQYRRHFGERDELHFFAGGGLGLGCINHRDYGAGDTCSGAWHLAATGGLWMPVVRHFALTGEVMAIGSGPTKVAFTPLLAITAVLSF